MKLLIITASLFLGASFAENATFPGNCPVVGSLANFDTNKYQGPWYEISKFNNTLVNGDCGYSNYTWWKNQFNVTYVTRNVPSGQNSTTFLTLKPLFNTPTSTGRFDVYEKGTVKQNIPYFVLETDYTNYSVVWGCTYSNGRNTQRLFVYSRRATLAKDFLIRANATLTRYKIDPTKQRNVIQDPGKCGRPRSFSDVVNGWMGVIGLL